MRLYKQLKHIDEYRKISTNRSQILPKLFRWACSRLDKRSPVQPVSTLGYTSLYYRRNVHGRAEVKSTGLNLNNTLLLCLGKLLGLGC